MKQFHAAVRSTCASLGLLCLVGCATSHFGTYPDQLAAFPARPISVTAAVESAEPYLDETLRLNRAARRSDWPKGTASIRVRLRGNKYDIIKENYPSMNAHSGFGNAVTVDAQTGQVTLPKSR